MTPEYRRLFREDGSLLYEGCTVHGKAYGPGRSYDMNGSPLHAGLFDIKGLLIGREYYPNGQVRFEGIYQLNTGYGPNWPEYGTWFGEDGTKRWHGRFTVRRSGLGYPTVVQPDGYGIASFPSQLGDHLFMWEDDNGQKSEVQTAVIRERNRWTILTSALDGKPPQIMTPEEAASY